MQLPPPVPAPATSPYRSPAGLGHALQVLFVVLALLGAMSIAAQWVRFVLVDRLINDPTSVTVADLTAGDDRARALFLASSVVNLAVIVVFIIWTHRLYRNVPVLGFQPRFTAGWAIGGWFVPILNLWRPKQIIDDIWRGSAPPPETPRRGSPVSPLLHVWWAVFIVSGSLRYAADAAASTPEGVRTAVTRSMVSYLVWVIASILAFWVVRRLTRRQIDAATNSAAPGHVATPFSPVEPRRPVPVWLRVAALPAAVVLVTVSLAALWTGATSASESNDASRDARGTMIDDLRAGDCFDLPAETSQMLAVEVVPCNTRHDVEVVGFAEASADMDYPGDEEVFSVGAIACAKAFETYVEAPWPESGLNQYPVAPNEANWQEGDRDFICAAIRPDGQPLDYSIQGGGGIALAPNQAVLTSLDEGDCFDGPISTVVELQKCEDFHDNEVFAVVEHPASAADYPGDQTMIDIAVETCNDAFQTSVDAAHRGELAYGWIARPNAATWAAGHHTVVCALWNEDMDPLLGSMLVASESGETTP